MNKTLLAAGLLGFSAIALGAYGDHGLRAQLDESLMRSLEAAVRYQLVHAIALLGIGLALASPTLPNTLNKRLFFASVLFVAGTVIFSGAIYFKVIFGLESASQLAPFGGMTLMTGWLMLAWAGCIKKGASN